MHEDAFFEVFREREARDMTVDVFLGEAVEGGK